MKVTSTDTIHFSSLNWGITAGETKELPEDKDSQAIILAHPSITPVNADKKPEQKQIEK